MEIKNDYGKAFSFGHRNLALVYKSILVGLCAGFVTILYRIALTQAELWSLEIYGWLRENTLWIILAFPTLAIVGIGTGLLVKKYPLISRSGIPQVKGQLLGYFKPQWVSTLIYKFLGGIITILAGLSVGREGPSIQLGSAAANGISNRLASSRTEKKVLIASGASAGLAVAFNAPLAGVMFALEEIFRYFSPTVLLATLSAAVSAEFLAEIVFGLEPIFHFTVAEAIPLYHYIFIGILGILIGGAGAFYNFFLLKTISVYERIGKKSQWLKSIIPFVIAGILGLTFPVVLGGGGQIVDNLTIEKTLPWLVLVLVLKFLFSMISFGSGVPGGIFFPLMVIGALVGAIYGQGVLHFFDVDTLFFDSFVIFAMAGFFAAIVRAPLTGIILLTEMTGSFSHFLPLTFISVIAYTTADFLRSAPIYESLLVNLLKDREGINEEGDHFRKTTFETVVHHGSRIENQSLKDLALPDNALIVAIRRNGRDITPRGNTVIKAGDSLIILTNINLEASIREILQEWTEG